MTHIKTVETLTEPAFIITNGAGADIRDDYVLLLAHWYSGLPDEVVPKVTLETDGVIVLEKNDIRALIAALEEFLQ